MLKNVAWTVLSRYGSQGLSLVSNVFLVRYLGAAGYGEYALASSIMLIGNAFTSFGMDMILIRRIAAGGDDVVISDGVWGQVFLSMLYILGTFVVGLFVALPVSLKIYTLALLPLAFYSIFTIIVRARQEMRLYSIAQVVISALHLLSVFILWLFNGDVLTFLLLLMFAHILVSVWGLARKEVRISHWRFDVAQVFQLLKECSYMALIGTLRLVYEKVAFTLLPSLTSLANVGIFSAASRVVESGKLGHQSALTTIYPEMARDGDFGKRMKGMRPLMLAAVLISIGLSVLAEPVVVLLFGDDFHSAALPLRIMAWTVVPYVFVTYLVVGLVALGYERTLLPSRFIILISLVVLLLLLTPRFGISGSAFAILIAEFIHVGMIWHLWRIHVLSKLS